MGCIQMNNYLNTVTEEPEGGFIKVRNGGAFVAAFTISYYVNGKKYTIESNSIPVMWDDTINIPWNAKDITFSVQIAMFFGIWRTIYTQKFSSPVGKCYLVQGVTAYATCTEIPCSDGGNGSNGNNICCCKCICKCKC